MLQQRFGKQSRFTLVMLSALAIGGALGSSNAVAAAATATTAATVVQPIAITAPVNLVFGKFAALTGGTVVLTPGGARTATGTVFPMAGITAGAARFDVTGDTTSTYSIALSGTTVLTSGVDTMAFSPISALTASAATTTASNVTSGTLSAGAQSIFVGGILTVASAQPPGAYAGTVIATVEYN